MTVAKSRWKSHSQWQRSRVLLEEEEGNRTRGRGGGVGGIVQATLFYHFEQPCVPGGGALGH